MEAIVDIPTSTGFVLSWRDLIEHEKTFEKGVLKKIEKSSNLKNWFTA